MTHSTRVIGEFGQLGPEGKLKLPQWAIRNGIQVLRHSRGREWQFYDRVQCWQGPEVAWSIHQPRCVEIMIDCTTCVGGLYLTNVVIRGDVLCEAIMKNSQENRMVTSRESRDSTRSRCDLLQIPSCGKGEKDTETL